MREFMGIVFIFLGLGSTYFGVVYNKESHRNSNAILVSSEVAPLDFGAFLAFIALVIVRPFPYWITKIVLFIIGICSFGYSLYLFTHLQ